MKWLVLTALFLGLSKPCYANSLSVGFGPSLDGTIGTVKVLSLGYELTWSAFSLEPEMGLWNEAVGGFGGYGGLTAGIHVTTPDGIFARAAFGPEAITQTDDRLSSLFEFHIVMKAGIEWESFAVWLAAHHMSDAGLYGQNLGRDFVQLGFSIPL
jgi:Lipid A 3-O-deacylase (PagL)